MVLPDNNILTARLLTHFPADKDKLLVEALKEVKSTRAEKAAWGKEQKALQTQVGLCTRALRSTKVGCSELYSVHHSGMCQA